MTTSNQSKSTPHFVLLVYGKPTSADLPQASWFRAEDRPTVVAAAESLKFSVLGIQADNDSTLLDGVHEGVLKGTGRMIVGSVTPEVYRRIEEYAAKANGAAVQGSNDTASAPNAASEQNTNVAKGKPAPVADPWDGLRVGSHVVAKYWLPTGEADGWWVAKVTAINGKDFTLRWLDEPETPPLKAERKHVAILNPAFDVDREWDRKR
jgi:hypothetical protein